MVIKAERLYLVAISSLGESELQVLSRNIPPLRILTWELRTQLDFLYAQILSTLTLSSLNKAFTSMPNYDLRNLLGGTEIFLDALADAMINADPGILLGSLEVLKLRKSTREKINTALLNARHEDLLYGMIVAEARLVSVIRPRRHSLHPPGPPPSHPHNHVRFGNSCLDMQLLFSMVFNSTSFLNGNEHWIPLCLPKFNAKGFLHAYIWAQDRVAVILISANKNAFFSMREVKEKVFADLTKSGIWDKVLTSVQRGRYLMGTSPSHQIRRVVGLTLVCRGRWSPRNNTLYLQVARPSAIHDARPSVFRPQCPTAAFALLPSPGCCPRAQNARQDISLHVEAVQCSGMGWGGV